MEEREKGCEGSYPSGSSTVAPDDALLLTRQKTKGYESWKQSKRHDSVATSSLSSSSSSSSCGWNRLFDEGYRADVWVYTNDGMATHAHACVLGMASPVLKSMLRHSKCRPKSITIPGVPHPAARAFLRYLYVSCWDEEEMREFAVHLLVLSHAFVVPSLKKECMIQFEKGLLNTENVIDIFQLSYCCDCPRLHLICHRMIMKSFKEVSATDGWRCMKESEPLLEKMLLEALVEASSREEERSKRMEEKRIYVRLWDTMEALVHICGEGCKTIGPCDKDLKGEAEPCRFPACKGLENLIRHFAGCKDRAKAGSCSKCKRMWQLLELHSRICAHPHACKVPLCRQLQTKKQNQRKKETAKWNLLASRMLAVKKGARILPFRPTLLPWT